MSSIKKLASQTVIYGLSSIVARLLNFLLTPIHTEALPKVQYGENVDIYSMIAFLMVILMWGMETSFFRFYRDNDKQKVYSHTASLVIFLSLLSVGLVWLFIAPISNALLYQAHPEYVMYMMLIVAIDAITAVPFAKLRAENKAVKFVILRSASTVTIVLLNLAYFWLFPWLESKGLGGQWLPSIYDKEIGVGYIFISNVIGNVLLLMLFMPDLLQIKFKFDFSLYRKLIIYASPLVIAGLATKVNEFSNRIFLKYLLPDGLEQAGIFGANFKIATFMVLFIQAFRYAAEPFFFSGDQKNYKEQIAVVMRYFVVIQVVLLTAVVCFLDIIKHFIDKKYWEGLDTVPILLFANLLMGINFNLNIWYKLENRTKYGAYITFVGLAFTLAGNLILIPKMGYMGAAWSTLASLAAMTGYSYYLNQKHAHTNYPWQRITMHLLVSAIISTLAYYYFNMNLFATVPLFLSFVIYISLLEGKPLLAYVQHVRSKNC